MRTVHYWSWIRQEKSCFSSFFSLLFHYCYHKCWYRQKRQILHVPQAVSPSWLHVLLGDTHTGFAVHWLCDFLCSFPQLWNGARHSPRVTVLLQRVNEQLIFVHCKITQSNGWHTMNFQEIQSIVIVGTVRRPMRSSCKSFETWKTLIGF